jgi:glycosyltransferase involved in cell wall biosynthesis
MTSPKVSVIVPVFNGEEFIGEALASLCREQDVEVELIVVDDGSTDGSVGIVKTLAKQDPRIRLIIGEHRGASAARNIGVRAAIGEYITFLDCDDISTPGRIARQARKLAAHPGVAAVVGETLLVEALTPDLEPVPGSRNRRTLGVPLQSALFGRSVFEIYGLFDERLDLCEDLDFFLRLSEGGARFLIETELASLYRRHSGNTTKNIQRLQTAMLAAFQRSIARRRTVGRSAPLDLFFFRRFTMETIFSSTGSECVASANPLAFDHFSNNDVL